MRNDNLTVTLQVPVTPEMAEALDQRAARLGLSRAAVCRAAFRRLVREERRREGELPSAVSRESAG